MKLTKDFNLKEFVSPKIYRKFGARSIIFLDSRLPQATQELRDFISKPIIINGRFNSNTYRYSGFRSFLAKSFSWYSQHRFGRAIDIKVKGMKTREVYDFLLTNQSRIREIGFTTIEFVGDTPTWIHLDMRMLRPDFEKDRLLIVRAKKLNLIQKITKKIFRWNKG